MSFGVKLGKFDTFEFNPRGNIWYNDENTLGRKMLSKMGWQKGKGLGRNEDGIKENLQVTKKYDNTGVGWKNNFTNSVGCTEYNNILKKLQETFKDEKTEEKSCIRKVPRRRHIYCRKFEKDISQCSEKDLKCIFIENSEELSKKMVDSTDKEMKEEKTETPTFESKFNMKEYFEKKMEKKKSLASNIDSKEDESLIFMDDLCCESPEFKVENTNKEKTNERIENQKNRISERKRKHDFESTIEENVVSKKPACMDIPRCSASNFNLWLESQRAAMKMKTYQDMFTKLKTHPVFKTTNLLDIKGYGNW